jgi:hypothetical protein
MNSGIIGAKGQIYKITEVPDNILNGVNVGYKIGDGKSFLNQLPWELHEEIQELNKKTTLNLLKNDSETKQILDTQTNNYIGSPKGTNQINSLISRYLTNNDVGDDLEDGIIINCN